MVKILIIVSVGALLYFTVRGLGKWQQRALSAEKQIRQNRKAHDIQNRVITDTDFRQRVRGEFRQR